MHVYKYTTYPFLRKQTLWEGKVFLIASSWRKQWHCSASHCCSSALMLWCLQEVAIPRSMSLRYSPSSPCCQAHPMAYWHHGTLQVTTAAGQELFAAAGNLRGWYRCWWVPSIFQDTYLHPWAMYLLSRSWTFMATDLLGRYLRSSVSSEGFRCWTWAQTLSTGAFLQPWEGGPTSLHLTWAIICYKVRYQMR